MRWLGLLFVLLFVIPADGQTITTVAGGGSTGADGIPATSSRLANPIGLVFDKRGDLLIADGLGHKIRIIDTDGIIHTLTGIGSCGFSGDSTRADTSRVCQPGEIVFDSIGNTYFTEASIQRVAKITATTGMLTVIAGTGISGFSGDGGSAIEAQLYAPGGLTMDKHGNLYIADGYNNHIRKIDTAGIITSIAGNHVLGGFSGDGGPATMADLGLPQGICFDDTGNLYIGDYANCRIRKVSPAGVITTFAGNGAYTYNGEGMNALSANIVPTIVLFYHGELYFVDVYNNRIRKVDASGIVTTVAGNGGNSFSGDGGPATEAEVGNPGAICMDSCGNLFIGQTNSPRIRKVALSPGCAPAATPVVAHHQQQICIQPNPAWEEIKLYGCAAGDHVQICDMTGREVSHTRSLSADPVINISHLPPGLYLVRVNGTSTQKLIKR